MIYNLYIKVIFCFIRAISMFIRTDLEVFNFGSVVIERRDFYHSQLIVRCEALAHS
jgi:hypothetical protein